jgi:glycosyltransferase involved in cell wall biosynthesis
MKTQPARLAFEGAFDRASSSFSGNGATSDGVLRRRATIEAMDASSLDLSTADEWRVLVTLDGKPCDYLWLPGPGRVEDFALVESAVARHADSVFYYNKLVEQLRIRLGAQPPSYPRLTCSVVVCTRRRPDHIADCLTALGKLEPAPDRVIVVDNDPGELDCCRQVERAGALYVREDRRGLDNARNAGLRLVDTDLVAFTDDDCVPSRGWLRSLPELFADPLVAAVTGPGFAYSLNGLAQERFERTGGFTRGLRRQVWGWDRLHPAASTRTGAGANMIFRLAGLERLGEVFPPELDAGTVTQTGGDMYALYKVLARGYRVVYDPGTYVYHQHRSDLQSLHRTFWGYGVGLSSTLAKLVAEEKEITAPLVLRWLWAQQAVALRGYIAGREDRLDVAIGWDYLRGAFTGPAAWRRAKAAAGASATSRAEPRAASPRAIAPTPTTDRLEEIEVSVIIATRDRPGMLRRCLRALAAQVGCPGFEVIVIDDGSAIGGRNALVVPGELTARRIDTRGGIGPAAARNLGAQHARGKLLLFLDDDLVAAPDLIHKHYRAHCEERSGQRVVIGYSAPRPYSDTFAGQRATVWWEDHYRAKSRAISMTFTHMLSGNMSLSRAAFNDLGRFDTAFGRLRREDWEFGIRALQGGVELCYEPEAVARHEFNARTRGVIEVALLEGKGDARLHRLHPDASPLLRRPGLGHRLRHPLYETALRVLGRSPARSIAAITLDLLEVARARHLWLRLLGVTLEAAYLRGLISEGYRPEGRSHRLPALRIELTSRSPINPPPVVAPIIEVAVKGRRVARFAPRGGYWDPSIAEQIADALPDRWWPELSLDPPSGVTLDEAEATDLTGITVFHGPYRRRRLAAGSSRLRSVGATVIAAGDRLEASWQGVDEAIRGAANQLIAIALPGVRPDPEWVRAVKPSLAATKIAAVLGAALPYRNPHPLALVSRAQVRSPFPLIGHAEQYVALRRDIYVALGGFDLSLATLGTYAVLIDFVERALNRGYVVGQRDAAGLKPVIGRRKGQRLQRERRRARAALMARHAHTVGGAWWLRHGLAPVVYQLWAGMRRQSGVGRVEAVRYAWAFAIGTLVGLQNRKPKAAGETIKRSPDGAAGGAVT